VAFAAVDPHLDLPALESEVLARWRADGTFAASLARREGAEEWVFYEGPPTANGRPGIHHAWARFFKDLYPRFHTMRGRYVARKAGWDCHGLPVEVEVEKELGIRDKHEIAEFGIAAFNERCRASVRRYVEDWGALTERLGVWLDLDDPYWTMSNDYIESVWWHLRTLWDRGLLYEDAKVVPYCGRCGTALSSHELGQTGAYRDVTEDSVYVRFPLLDPDGADAGTDLLVWTTTPWTLVSNTGVAIGPHVTYVRARSPLVPGRELVVAESRVRAVLGDDADVVARVPAAELIGRRYERPFDDLPAEGDGWRVVPADWVAVDEGTGLVHLAPAFGEVDREAARGHGLPTLNPVDPSARFTGALGDLAGTFVKDADPVLIRRLAARGRLVRVEPYTHPYPHCWRCSTPLVYWAKPSWFIRTSAHKDELCAQNETITWFPEHIKHGRFGDWLANNVDWTLSRDRFWGTPLPIWRCDACGADTCVGSLAELESLVGRDLAALDLHRPHVDSCTWTCRACGRGTARRQEAVVDVWLDSGAMPAAQWHYPFEGRDLFERRFPADFICEALDQTRGWFYSLLALNTLVFGRAPYRNVLCLGLLLDRDGQKMSKSRGNVVDPWEVIESRGADALRWSFVSSGSPWTARRVSLTQIDEAANRFLLTLWNTYAFFVTYANLDGWEPGAVPVRPTHVLDRWVRSRLHGLVAEVTEALEGFDALRAAQGLERFVDDLSNWYVRRSRPRFWASGDPAAHAVLHECLTTLTLLLAPFCPFVADALHANLTGGGSVHLADWPVPEPAARDRALEAAMEVARTVTSLGLAARTEARLKVRQPLPRAVVLLPPGTDLDDALRSEVADALNVKSLEVVRTLEGLLDYQVRPNFRRLGPRLGPRLARLRDALAEVDGADLQRALASDGTVRLDLDGEEVVLGPEDLTVRARAHEEFALAEDGPYAVALDTRVTPELRREGLAREVVRTLNEHRKRLGLAIADRVEVRLAARGELAAAVDAHRDWIAGEVLARRLERLDELAGGDELVVDGSTLRVDLQRCG
jgi:isoleucyl-tRNA synthetase